MRLRSLLTVFLAAAATPGVAAESQAPPPVAAVGTLRDGESDGCGATLVAPDLVLTAAHCATGLRARIEDAPGAVRFVTGAYPGHPSVSRAVTVALAHPLFRDKTRDFRDRIRADIGMLRLEHPIPPDVARPLPIAEGPWETGTRMIVGVWPGRDGVRAHERGCRLIEARRWVLVLGCRVISGDSGSGVLALTAEGPVFVGVLSARSDMDRQPLAHVVRAAPRIGQLHALMP